MNEDVVLPVEQVDSIILLVRGQKVILGTSGTSINK